MPDKLLFAIYRINKYLIAQQFLYTSRKSNPGHQRPRLVSYPLSYGVDIKIHNVYSLVFHITIFDFLNGFTIPFFKLPVRNSYVFGLTIYHRQFPLTKKKHRYKTAYIIKLLGFKNIFELV